jgi:FKBP-type peptidyl-prolyl cis-trans isomerase FklB
MSISSYLQQLKADKIAKNREAGLKFLAENKTKPGVVTLPDGLQYLVLKEGTGPKPTINDKVKTHYHGTLIDGTVFDSSVDRGQPISFPVGGVIKGWTEALQLMPVGSKWRLFIPSELAYGDRGAGPKIGPGAALVFEVELLAIEQ